MKEETMCSGTGSLKVDVGKDLFRGGGRKSPADREKNAVAVAGVDGSKTKKKMGRKKENPYASRGLDKFATVLAELESRREKVLRRVDSDDVLVRFVQSERRGWVPIVVKLPPEELQDKNAKGDSKKKCCFKSYAVPAASSPPTPTPRESASPRCIDVKHAIDAAAPVAPMKKAVARRWSWGRKVIRPSEYWPFVSVLLLVSLVVFGRVFAICSTSIWWYLVPMLSGSNGGQIPRRSMAKIGKELGKKATDKKRNENLADAPLPPKNDKKISSGSTPWLDFT